MRPWLVAIALVCLVGAATATISTVTASTGDSFRFGTNLETPNRVLTVPLSLPDAISQFALTFTGTNFNSVPDIAVGFIPAVCQDCICSNLPGPQQFATFISAPFLTQDTKSDTQIVTVLSGDTTAEPTVRRAFVESIGFDRGARICVFEAAGLGTPSDLNTLNGLGFLTTSFNCATTPCATGLPNAVNNAANLFTAFLNGDGIAALVARTQECRATVASVCTCYNPRTTIACCGGNLYDTTVYKCCGDSTIVRLGDGCPCTSDSQCSSLEPRCCFQTKFPELRNSTTGVLTNGTGVCYSPSVHRCCDTGARYDPGQDQCCAINGVQSLNVPCPCNVDSHCQGGQSEGRTTDFVCCRQVDPVPIEASSCSIYSNFPSGTGPFFSQRCLGQCIDPTFQLCCNGNSCRKEFEKCCNTTCCNNFVGACHRVQKGIAGQRYNSLNFAVNPSDPESQIVVFERCTTIEQMTPIRAFWIFVLPTAFLLATFLGLAVALVFANKAAVRVFTWVERFLVFFAVILSLLACPLYFSPLYKYGGVIALIAFWAIVTAATRVRWINGVAIAALIFLQIYLYDPFHGSAYFNLAYWRIWTDSPFAGATDPRSNGILHTTRMMFPNVTTTNSAQWCSRYYDYFIYDVQLRDFDREDNPLRTTFGYCSRGWVMALYLLSGFIFIASLILLLLAIIALVARFRKEILEPVELEVRAVQDFAPVY